MAGEILRFGELVAQQTAATAEELRTRLNEQIADEQKRYDTNKGILDNLGLQENFDNAAEALRQNTAKVATVEVSPRPYIGRSQLDHTSQQIVGNGAPEITLKWEPKGTVGVTYSMAVRVDGDTLTVLSDSTPETIQLDSEDTDTSQSIDEALMRAFNKPRGSEPSED